MHATANIPIHYSTNKQLSIVVAQPRGNNFRSLIQSKDPFRGVLYCIYTTYYTSKYTPRRVLVDVYRLSRNQYSYLGYT